MTDYKAKSEIWKGFENLYGTHNPFNPLHSEFVDTILELRSRVETLEANSSVPLTSSGHSAKSELSLVERVVMAIGRDGEQARWHEARAAIREVAAWLRGQQELGAQTWAWHLEHEAKR